MHPGLLAHYSSDHSPLPRAPLPGTAEIGSHSLQVWQQALIIKAALVVDRRLGAVLEWFAGCPIASLGGLTAQQLVAAGHGGAVLAFLYRIAGESTDALSSDTSQPH